MSLVPPPPRPPPQVPANPQLFRNPYKANSEILKAAKAALKKVVPEVKVVSREPPAVPGDDVDNGNEHSYAAAALAFPPSPALEISVDVDDVEIASMECNTSSSGSQSKPKKAKLSEELALADKSLSSSPDLHHKLPSKSRQESEDDKDFEGDEENSEKTNMFGLNFMMWFEIGIEGKSPMNQEEEDWGGRIEFGFSDSNFSKDFEDYFLLFEDECSLPHNCAGRVMGVQSHLRKRVVAPPSYDPRSIMDLLDKYRDAHISDSGWREVDPEEWHLEKLDEK